MGENLMTTMSTFKVSLIFLSTLLNQNRMRGHLTFLMLRCLLRFSSPRGVARCQFAEFFYSALPARPRNLPPPDVFRHIKGDTKMPSTTIEGGERGTTDPWPRWEGPPENRPRGYLPAKDDPAVDRNAAGENLANPDRSSLPDTFATGGDASGSEDDFERAGRRAFAPWEHDRRPDGSPDAYWRQFFAVR